MLHSLGDLHDGDVFVLRMALWASAETLTEAENVDKGLCLAMD